MKELCSFCLLAIVLTLSGCGFGPPAANRELVAQFVETDGPTSDETLIYIAKRDSIDEPAPGYTYLINGKTTYGHITGGEYFRFKLTSKSNVLSVLLNGKIRFTINLQDRAGETVFIFNEGVYFVEVQEDVGKTLIMQSTQAFPVRGVLSEGELEKYYDENTIRIYYHPGSIPSLAQTAATSGLRPDDEYAVITFIRAQTYAPAAIFNIFNKDGLIGQLRTQTYFQLKVKPGKHIFISKAEQWSIVDAEVEAGRSYYILGVGSMGGMMINFRLLPMTKENNLADNLLKWLKDSTLVQTLKPSNITQDPLQLEAIKRVFLNAVNDCESGKLKSRSLRKDDFF